MANNVTLTLSFDSFEAAQDFINSHGVPPSQATVSVDARTAYEKIMDELEDPRFSLRSVSELTTQTGLSRTEIETMLRCHDVDYVIRRRRSDGAALIGLADRS